MALALENTNTTGFLLFQEYVCLLKVDREKFLEVLYSKISEQDCSICFGVKSFTLNMSSAMVVFATNNHDVTVTINSLTSNPNNPVVSVRVLTNDPLTPPSAFQLPILSETLDPD